MRTPWRTTAILLTGALVLASGAYAIGTQVGGGSADARDSRDGARAFRPGEPVDDLADALGVDADKLRDALADFGSQQRSERKDAFAAALADALGKSTDEVQRALEQRHDAERTAFAKRLAAALDLDPADVEAALEKVMGGDRPRRPGDFIDELAGELGVSADRLENALRKLRPPMGRHGDCAGPGPGGEDLSGLAAALDVTPAELRRALRQIWTDREPGRAGGRGELEDFLAKRFGLSADRVAKALDDSLPPPPGRGFRRGPGAGFEAAPEPGFEAAPQPGFGPPGPHISLG